MLQIRVRVRVRVRVKDRDNTGYYRLYSVHCHQWKRLRNYFYCETRIREGRGKCSDYLCCGCPLLFRMMVHA